MYSVPALNSLFDYCLKTIVKRAKSKIVFKLNIPTYTLCMYTYKNKTATIIQVRKLIKGGNY